MVVANVLNSENLIGSQYKSAKDAVTTLANLPFAPADVATAASGLQNVNSVNDAVGADISVAKGSLTLIEAVATKVPYLGTALSIGSLGLNLQKLNDEWASGSVSAGTAAAVLGDFAAVSGIVAALAIGGPAGVALGVALTGISAGLTVVSISPNIKDDPVWL